MENNTQFDKVITIYNETAQLLIDEMKAKLKQAKIDFVNSENAWDSILKTITNLKKKTQDAIESKNCMNMHDKTFRDKTYSFYTVTCRYAEFNVELEMFYKEINRK